MRRLTRPLAFAVGATLVVGAVALTAIPGQAQTAPSLIKLELKPGYTLLDTTSNRVTSTTSTATQSIEVGCDRADVLAPISTLLDVNVDKPNNARLGYGKNGIGVSGSKDKSGTRCADVDSEYGQSLEVKVGSAGGVWSAADLDIEFKGGSNLVWKAFRGTTDVTTGVSVRGLPGQVADNGPDSGDGDNYRVVFTANGTAGLFDRLVLTPTGNGALSLEGGGDGTSASSLLPTTSASVFMAPPSGEGLLLCDKSDPDGVSENGVTVFFTDCASESSVPYLLDRPTGSNAVTFAVPNSATNEYRVEIEWIPEAAQLPVPKNSKVAYFRQASDGSLVEQTLDLCGGTEDAPTVPVDYDGNMANGNQGFCIAGQAMRLGTVAGEMIVTERLYGVGDPAFGRLSN
jgi:hypothetical protein